MLLDEEETVQFKRHATAISICGLLSTIAIPWQLINMLTLRDNPEKLRPALARYVHATQMMSTHVAAAQRCVGSGRRRTPPHMCQPMELMWGGWEPA